jgi:hypothetical protein
MYLNKTKKIKPTDLPVGLQTQTEPTALVVGLHKQEIRLVMFQALFQVRMVLCNQWCRL